MDEGKLEGIAVGFFGLVIAGDTDYVFSKWSDLQAYQASGGATGYSEKGQDGPRGVQLHATPQTASRAAPPQAPRRPTPTHSAAMPRASSSPSAPIRAARST